MNPILTDWLTIATAGPTADGREISEKALIEVAETYNRDEYAAFVNCDHLYGNLGEVWDVRTQKDAKGRTCLQARIRPNMYYLSQNAQDFRLCFSAELMSNFAKSGKTYLVGLATTDDPASVGTTVARFSMKKDAMTRCEPVELSAAMLAGKEENPGLAQMIRTAVKEFFSSQNTNKTVQEDNNMDAEAFKKLAAAVDGVVTKLSALESKIEAFGKTNEAKPEATATPAATAATGKPEEFNMKEAFATLTKSLDGLKESFADAMKTQPGRGQSRTAGETTEPLI